MKNRNGEGGKMDAYVWKLSLSHSLSLILCVCVCVCFDGSSPYPGTTTTRRPLFDEFAFLQIQSHNRLQFRKIQVFLYCVVTKPNHRRANPNPQKSKKECIEDQRKS